jgi:acyl carrier protein
LTLRGNRRWTHEKVVSEITSLVEQHTKRAVRLIEATELIGDLGFDSLAAMDLVGDIEDRFEISIEDAELLEVVNFGDVVRAVELRLHRERRLSG